MRLRDYINNSGIEVNFENKNEAYILSKEIIDMLKNKEYEIARALIDENIEQLYINLDIDSFCCLIDFYTNNVELESRYLEVLDKKSIPKLLINLSKEEGIKEKMYFIGKLNEFNKSQSWDEVIVIIDVLINKTDIDALEMYKSKLNILVNLKRYDEVLQQCDELLSSKYKTNEFINTTKLNTLIAYKRFNDLENYLKIAEYILDRKLISKGYIALAKYYEGNKENEKAYLLYNKANELDSNYKIPATITYKIKGIEDTKLKKGIDKFNSNKKLKSILILVILLILAVQVGKFAIDKLNATKSKVQTETEVNNDPNKPTENDAVQTDEIEEVIETPETVVAPTEVTPEYYELTEDEKRHLIEERMASFEYNFVESVNTGNISILEDDLLPGEDYIYNKYKGIVEDYYSRDLKEIAYEHEVTDITEVGKDEYKVNIYEKFGVIKNGAERIVEFDSIYLVKFIGNQCYIKNQLL